MKKDWIEVSVSVSPEVVDDLTSSLYKFIGSAFSVEERPAGTGFDPTRITIRAFIAPGPNQATIGSEVNRALDCLRLAGEGMIGIATEALVKEDEYLNRWRNFYRAIPVGSKLMIVPAWQRELPECNGRIQVILDSGAAFGTGHHPTTQLALKLLEELMVPGLTVADVGTGSGILAIAAVRLGASRVVAFDNDGQVRPIAESNIQRNGVQDLINLCVPSHGIERYGHVDLVIANIVASVHVELMSSYAYLLRSGGTAILSGVLDERLHEVTSRADECGLKMTRYLADGDWRAMIFGKDGKGEELHGGSEVDS